MSFCNNEEFLEELEERLSNLKDLADLKISDLLPHLTNETIVSLFAVGKNIEEKYKINNIRDLSIYLNVPTMTETRNRRKILISLLKGDCNRLLKVHYESLSERFETFRKDTKDLFQNFTSFLNVRTPQGAYIGKVTAFLSKYRKAKDLSYDCIEIMTGASKKMLQRYEYKEDELLFNHENPDQKTEKFLEDWKKVPPGICNRLENVIPKMQEINPEYSAEYIREMISKCGLMPHRFPKKKSTGTDCLEAFQPFSCASADGKHLKITLNGHSFEFVWYPFVCSTTKLFLGSFVGKTENSEAFLGGINDVKKNIGNYPIAVVIDNRLSKTGDYHIDDENAKKDIPENILSFLREKNIVLIKTFRSNPKSNTIENSFSTFQNHATDFEFDFRNKTDEENAKELAIKHLKMYMNIQNSKSRAKFGGRSAEEFCQGKTPAEGDRDALEKLKNRHLNLNAQSESIIEKGKSLYKLIPDNVTSHFVFFRSQGKPNNRFYNTLAMHDIDDIISTSAKFAARCQQYPSENYDERYYCGILKNIRSERIKKTFHNTYLSGVVNAYHFFKDIKKDDSISNTAEKLVKDLYEIGKNTEIHHRTYFLNEFCSFLLFLSSYFNLYSLWDSMNNIMLKKDFIDIPWHSAVVKHVFDRIGPAIISSRDNKNIKYLDKDDFFDLFFKYKDNCNEKKLLS